MKNITLTSLLKPFRLLFRKFHLTLFIILSAVGLTVAVISLNDLLSISNMDDTYVSPIGAGSIDQATLDRIKELHTSAETVPETQLPAGRINPFGE